MDYEQDRESMSRRELIRRLALSATGIALLKSGLGAEAAQTAGSPAPDAPFRVGVVSSTLRKFSVDDALAKTQALGVAYWEGSPDHFPITDDPNAIAGYQEMLKAHNIRMPAYGVVDFTTDEADARRKFAFAKAMNIRTLTALPTPDSLSLVDRLAQEYKINIALLNQGSGGHYATWQDVLDALNAHSKHIGACDATGAYLQLDNQSPVTAAYKFDKRLYDIRLQNVLIGPDKQKKYVDIGTTGGLLDTLALFRILATNKYRHLIALEAAGNEQEPMPHLEKDLTEVRGVIKTVHSLGLISPSGWQ